MNISTKKLFGVAFGLLNISFMSSFGVSALPGGCLVYFVGKEQITDKKVNVNSLYNKNCCKCGKNLAERCGQFCCSLNCAKCALSNCYSNPTFVDIFEDGCDHKKEQIFSDIKSKGCFCFIEYEENEIRSDDQVFEDAKKNNKLYCAYCMSAQLKKVYGNFVTDVIKLPENVNLFCIICFNKLLNSDKKSYCKVCRSAFHNSCLSKWCRRKDICPTCKRSSAEQKYDKKFAPKNEQSYNLLNCYELESCTDCSDVDEFFDELKECSDDESID